MTFPVVESVTNSQQVSATTTPTVSMPAVVNAGDRLIAIHGAFQGGGGVGTSGFTALIDGAGSNIYEKIADGTEGGTTVQFSQNNARFSCQVYRISGAHASTPGEVSSRATGTSSAPDSGSVTPSWGSEDTLWIAAAVWGHSFSTDRSYSAAPTNYTGTTYSNASGSFSQSATCSAWRQLAASSEDPGAHTLSGSITWGAITCAIRPAGAPAANTRRHSLTLAGVG